MSRRLVTVEVKRGTTLGLLCAVRHAGGPIDLTGWTIEAAVRSDRLRVFAFDPYIVSAADGVFVLYAWPADTGSWPAGLLSADIRYTDPTGFVAASESFAIASLDSETL